MQSGTIRIEHKEPVFRYQATLVSADNSIEYGYELTSDGREVTGTDRGRATISSLRWDGDALIYTGRIQRPGSEMTVSFRYELLDSRRGLRAVEQIRGAGRDQDNVWIFDRR